MHLLTLNILSLYIVSIRFDCTQVLSMPQCRNGPLFSSTRLLNEGPINARLISKWRDCTRTTTCTSSAAEGGAQGAKDCESSAVRRRLELNRKDRGVPRLAYADAYDTHTLMRSVLCEQFVCWRALTADIIEWVNDFGLMNYKNKLDIILLVRYFVYSTQFSTITNVYSTVYTTWSRIEKRIAWHKEVTLWLTPKKARIVYIRGLVVFNV